MVYMEGSEGSTSWLTSEGAKLISSSSTQWPWRSALTRAPSWKAKAKPPSASWAALSADVTLFENLAHSSLHRTRMLLLRHTPLYVWQLPYMACIQLKGTGASLKDIWFAFAP